MIGILPNQRKSSKKSNYLKPLHIALSNDKNQKIIQAIELHIKIPTFRFAYTHRISEEDTASEKTVETLDEKKNSTAEAVKEVQMLAAKQAEWDRQFQLRRSLRHTAHEKIAQLRRAVSSPDLTDAVPDEQ